MNHRFQKLPSFLVFFAVLSLVGCISSAPPETPVAPTPTSVVTNPSTGLSWVSVYFTDPAHTDEADQDLSHYITAAVLPAIEASLTSIDVASFDLNLPGFVDALVRAGSRGVTVRVVYDGTNGNQTLKGSETVTGEDFDAIKTLAEAHIPLVNGGRSNGLMHDKIIIVDSQILFIGSWNMSYNDTFRNNNNLLAITDPDLIANYQAKFKELFVDKVFGAKSRVGAQTPSLTLDGTQVENYFSPVDNVMDHIVAQVIAAKKSIRFMAFTYTDKRLSNAMIAQANAGRLVQGVIENRGASNGALVPLFCANVPVEVDGNKYTMHHKVIIIDDSTVITGSFNFTATADEANDENVLFIHSPSLAALYLRELAKVYQDGKAPDAAKLNCPAK